MHSQFGGQGSYSSQPTMYTASSRDPIGTRSSCARALEARGDDDEGRTSTGTNALIYQLEQLQEENARMRREMQRLMQEQSAPRLYMEGSGPRAATPTQSDGLEACSHAAASSEAHRGAIALHPLEQPPTDNEDDGYASAEGSDAERQREERENESERWHTAMYNGLLSCLRP